MTPRWLPSGSLVSPIFPLFAKIIWLIHLEQNNKRFPWIINGQTLSLSLSLYCKNITRKKIIENELSLPSDHPTQVSTSLGILPSGLAFVSMVQVRLVFNTIATKNSFQLRCHVLWAGKLRASWKAAIARGNDLRQRTADHYKVATILCYIVVVYIVEWDIVVKSDLTDLLSEMDCAVSSNSTKWRRAII